MQIDLAHQVTGKIAINRFDRTINSGAMRARLNTSKSVQSTASIERADREVFFQATHMHYVLLSNDLLYMQTYYKKTAKGTSNKCTTGSRNSNRKHKEKMQQKQQP